MTNLRKSSKTASGAGHSMSQLSFEDCEMQETILVTV